MDGTIIISSIKKLNEATEKGSFSVIVPVGISNIRKIEIGFNPYSWNVIVASASPSFSKMIKAFKTTGLQHENFKIMQVVDGNRSGGFAYEYMFDDSDYWRIR